MSFSSIVKNGLCRMEIDSNCCLLAELAAVIRINGIIRRTDRCETNIKIVTENAAFARKLFSMVRCLFGCSPEVIIRKSKKLKKHLSYILVITAAMGVDRIFDSIGISNDKVNNPADQESKNQINEIFRKNCCKKAFIRGAFLSGGSISDPEKTYHLEITSHDQKFTRELNTLLNSFGLNSKVVKRKGNYVTYLKEGENIVDFLNIIGAHSALLELENVRILKEMRNNVNRIVNCETANLEKTINASVRQIENIKYIKENIGFDNLPDNLREIAELRLAYNDANLKELGEMLTPPLGKSGVNHRLRKLDMIAEHNRESKLQK